MLPLFPLFHILRNTILIIWQLMEQNGMIAVYWCGISLKTCIHSVIHICTEACVLCMCVSGPDWGSGIPQVWAGGRTSSPLHWLQPTGSKTHGSSYRHKHSELQEALNLQHKNIFLYWFLEFLNSLRGELRPPTSHHLAPLKQLPEEKNSAEL